MGSFPTPTPTHTLKADGSKCICPAVKSTYSTTSKDVYGNSSKTDGLRLEGGSASEKLHLGALPSTYGRFWQGLCSHCETKHLFLTGAEDSLSCMNANNNYFA